MEMAWYLPVLIFCARICDVSLGTIRMIMLINGIRSAAVVLGFFEVVIWALAVGGVVKYLSEPVAVLAYAGGFAAGTMVGMMIEDKLAIGYRVVRVISRKPGGQVSEQLRNEGYRVTRVEGTGRDGPVEIAFMVLRRRHLQAATEAAHRIAPEAFITVERADKPVINSNGNGPSHNLAKAVVVRRRPLTARLFRPSQIRK